MAYETGSATNPADLLDKIRLFLTANGFTQNRWGNDGTGEQLNLQIDFGSGIRYFNFRSRSNYIELSLSTGYAAVAFGSQQDEKTTTGTRSSYHLYNTGAYTRYDFYYSANTFFCVVEFEPETFTFLSLGEVVKYGTWTGGAFIDTSNWSDATVYRDNPDTSRCCAIFDGVNHYRVLPNSGLANFLYQGHGQTIINSRTDSGGQSPYDVHFSGKGSPLNYHLTKINPSSATGRAIMTPIKCYLYEHSTFQMFPIGYIDTVKNINIKNHLPRDIVLADWVVYPTCKKGNPSITNTDEYNSGYYGIAVRRVL